jgi:hypothetical protein
MHTGLACPPSGLTSLCSVCWSHIHCPATNLWRVAQFLTWCAFSKMVTNLSNKILLCQNWDHCMLQSPAQPGTPNHILLPPAVSIAPAMPMAVEIPTTLTAQIGSLIDDLIWIFLNTPVNLEREPHSVPLAIHANSLPHMVEAEPVRC